MVLGGRVGQVVEDYDSSVCSTLYSDLSSSSSPRPEAVSNFSSSLYALYNCVCVSRLILTRRDIYLPTDED